MSKSVAYFTEPTEGELVPTYRFSNPYRPTEEFEIPQYSTVRHPCSFPATAQYFDWHVGTLTWGEWVPINSFEYNVKYAGYSTDVYPGPVWDGLQAFDNWPPDHITPPSTASRIYSLYVWGYPLGFNATMFGPDYAQFLIQFLTGPLAGYSRRVTASDFVEDEAINPNEDMDLYYIDVDPPFPTAPNPGDTFDILLDVFRYKQVVIQLDSRVWQHSTRATASLKPFPILILLADVPPGNPPTRPSIYYADQYWPVQMDNRFTVPTYISVGPKSGYTPYHQAFYRDANTAYDAIPTPSYVVDCQGALGLKIKGVVQNVNSAVWGSGV